MPLLEPDQPDKKSPFLFTETTRDNQSEDFHSLSKEEQDVLLDHVASEFANDPQAMERLAAKFLQEVTPNDFNTVAVQPQPGFVCKTKVEQSKTKKHKAGTKVYINICHADAIPKPPVANENEIQKALNANPAATYRVPLSMGQTRHEDNSLIMDACIHTQPYLRAERDLDFRLYIIELAIEFVEEMESVDLSREFTMPNLQSKGKIPQRMLRLPKPDLISNVKKHKNTKKEDIKQSISIDKKKDHLIIVIPDMPSVNPSSWTLDIEPSQMVIGGTGSTLKTIKLPKEIDVQHRDNEAKFYKKSKELVIELVLAPRRQFL
ncbi:pre-RNA processing PIH1/Nop17-domain-containing protein [Phascolomyces articulosus]|uniref:Pre-RNA processing PIH1/Nop17-domain-containing protein n=1 Tax=Phascolomyces articulosus TaxID=60185 RepID=A0AAD5PGP3_9FUNG|nr:pre-RNA processing PIH1/Nop17-domain-containing protein [Phascolomyces articulosus]